MDDIKIDLGGLGSSDATVPTTHNDPAIGLGGTTGNDTSGGGSVLEEITDPNKIIVTIGDKKSPIIMLFGPRSSGKSMSLVRLARYLRKHGYRIVVDSSFRPGESYRKMCDEFDTKLASNEALDGNALTDFMLVKIVKNGHTICQFLEAPGEHYFDPSDVTASNFPPYIQTVTTLPNRKIWVFIAESNWNVDSSVKNAYVQRISNCKFQLMGSADRSIILNNKVDRKTELIYGRAKVHTGDAIQAVADEYPGIFDLFENQNPVSRLWRKHDCKYVPFTTGSYRTTVDGTQTYTPSADEWPGYFWSTIQECLKG